MKTSLVVRTKDQWSRLRLVLASIEAQQGLDELVIVDDGSTDETWERLSELRHPVPLVTARNSQSIGQAATWNKGAAAASGELLIFLDGDTLANPGLVAAHVRVHSASPTPLIGRGETWHIRCTRFLSDPEAGTFWPHESERDRQTSDQERASMRITAEQIRDDFDAVHAKGAPGCYAGIGPKRLHEAELRVLESQTSSRLWAAASGSNSSVPRELFLRAGGFEPLMDINEHRELAYRLCAMGARMALVPGAPSYHLTHRVGWRDPLEDRAWEHVFRRKHPEVPMDELKHFWSRVGVDVDPAFF